MEREKYDYVKVLVSVVIGVAVLVALWLVSKFGGV